MLDISNNKIKHVDRLFVGINNSVTQFTTLADVFLQNNQLQNFDIFKLVEGCPNLFKLFLDGNNLTRIQDLTLLTTNPIAIDDGKFSEKITMKINGNPINCLQDISWLAKGSQTSEYVIKYGIFQLQKDLLRGLVCDSPIEWRGIVVFDLGEMMNQYTESINKHNEDRKQ